MGLKLLLFALSLFAVIFLSSQIVRADVKLCSSSADCGANAGCISGSCVCDPQWYNCDANFGNGCEHHYACSNTCTSVSQKYCYNNDVWNAYQSSDCGVGNGFFQDCSGSTPKCYQGGSSAGCVECLTNSDCSGGKTCVNNACVCPSGQLPNPYTGICESPPAPTQCSDGTLEGACCTNPGTKCKKDASDNLVCQTDPTCPDCYDTDPADDPTKKGVC